MNILKLVSSYRKLSSVINKHLKSFSYGNCRKINGLLNTPTISSNSLKGYCIFSSTNFRLIPLWSFFGLFGFNDEKEKGNLVDTETFMVKVFDEITNGKLNEAKMLLDQILKNVEDLYQNKKITQHQYNLDCSLIYKTYAHVLVMNNELDASIDKYQKAIKCSTYSGMSKGHEVIIELSLRLSVVYLKLQKFKEAVSGLQYVIENVENELNKFNNDTSRIQKLNALLVISAENYAKYLHDIQNFEESLLFSKKALEAGKLLYKKNNIHILNKMNEISNILVKMKNYKGAREQLEEAVDLFKENPSEDLFFIVSVIYTNIAMTYVDDATMGVDDKVKNIEIACKNSESTLKLWSDVINEDLSPEMRIHVTNCFDILETLKKNPKVD